MQSFPAILGNWIRGNTATSYGGGVCGKWSAVIVAGNAITGNSAGSGGGIDGSGTIVNNTIVGNRPAAAAGSDCSAPTTIANTIVAFNSSGVSNERRGRSRPCSPIASTETARSTTPA